MMCDVNTYAPEGKPMHAIVDVFASDNELWAEKFMKSWQQITNNGYAADKLEDGPQKGKIGYTRSPCKEFRFHTLNPSLPRMHLH